MPRVDRIRRVDFENEIGLIVSDTCTVMLEKGADKREIRAAMHQQIDYLKTYFPETDVSSLTGTVMSCVDDWPSIRDGIPLTLEVEREATVRSLNRIGRRVRGWDYSIEEGRRVVQMYSALLKFHLKSEDKIVKEVHYAIIGE